MSFSRMSNSPRRSLDIYLPVEKSLSCAVCTLSGASTGPHDPADFVCAFEIVRDVGLGKISLIYANSRCEKCQFKFSGREWHGRVAVWGGDGYGLGEFFG